MRQWLVMGLFAISANSFAQDSTAQLTTVTKASFLNPGISYEMPVKPNKTVYAQVSLSPSAYFSYSDALDAYGNISFDPAFTVQYRYYYNIQKRSAAGKRIERNSANYIAPMFEVLASEAYTYRRSVLNSEFRPVFHFGAVWGLQRNFAKRFSLDLNIGPGIALTKEEYISYIDYRNQRYEWGDRNVANFTILSQLNLGFWLNKR
jgi:putative salt-induced outer membrane protein YdiY